MDEKLVQRIATHLQSKTTEDLQAIWKKNDRCEYSDEGFEAVKRILTERNAEIPSQDPPPLPKSQQLRDFDVKKVKARRTLYLLFFLLMVAGSIGGAMLGAELALGVNFVMGIVFLVLFTSIARQVLGYSVGTLIVTSIVILFIPFFSLLTIALVDRKVYDAIKRKAALSESPAVAAQ